MLWQHAIDSSLLRPLLANAAADCGGIGTYAWAFGQGVLVDLTPCVYPLIPVTVAVFGAKGVSKSRALFLAAAYVLGMAVLYTSLGVAVALAAGGVGFGTWLANPWVVGPLVLILLALAASMFGAFDLQLPTSLETKLSNVGGGLVSRDGKPPREVIPPCRVASTPVKPVSMRKFTTPATASVP